MTRCFTLLAVVGALALATGIAGAGQGGRGGQRQGGGSGPDEGGVTPGEIQRMFDAYALMQAQEQLKIGDEHFSQFLTRYKALQELRGKNLQERARLLVDMRQMLIAPNPDEAKLKERMKELQDLETRSAADKKKAYDAIDQVLDVRQQAKFRVFEEAMERRKLELVTRARRANRPKNQK